MKLDVLIRADASTVIGSGHIARTSALADRLRIEGISVGFACRPFEGNRIAVLRSQSYCVYELSPGVTERSNWLGVSLADELDSMHRMIDEMASTPTWIVVDNYSLDERWEASMAKRGARIFVIDDLADRVHHCEGLLDQNYHPSEQRYANKVPQTARLFLGPAYALLRQEFAAHRRLARERDGTIKRILVLFGGFDLAGYATQAVRAILDARVEAYVDVIAPDTYSSSARDSEELVRGDPRFTIFDRTENVATMMVAADLAIGAAGVTAWERCFVGLPSIVSAIAANQEPALTALAKDDIVLSLGAWHKDQCRQLTDAIRALATDPVRTREYGRRSFDVCGDPDKGAEELLAFLKEPIECQI